jgi:ArsR family transcriptional regulator, lead/cadmium/zinc/bismuth-responsive transcriptional repressor
MRGDDEQICGRDERDDLGRCDVVVVDPVRVREVRARLLPPEEADAVADVFKVLADASRCRLVAALIEAGEICVCDLAATVQMSESNVSHHLRVLRAHGLVRGRRAGKMVFYSPDDAHIRILLDITREHVRHRAAGVPDDQAMPADTWSTRTALVEGGAP